MESYIHALEQLPWTANTYDISLVISNIFYPPSPSNIVSQLQEFVSIIFLTTFKV